MSVLKQNLADSVQLRSKENEARHPGLTRSHTQCLSVPYGHFSFLSGLAHSSLHYLRSSHRRSAWTPRSQAFLVHFNHMGSMLKCNDPCACSLLLVCPLRSVFLCPPCSPSVGETEWSFLRISFYIIRWLLLPYLLWSSLGARAHNDLTIRLICFKLIYRPCKRNGNGNKNKTV